MLALEINYYPVFDAERVWHMETRGADHAMKTYHHRNCNVTKIDQFLFQLLL
jgi:hypothetical protein